jgi:crotonobetainyl-CoA:carnitine CoA-transferase CaiB-like acyl-CoA transferase
VDVSLLDSVAALLTYQASRWLSAHETPARSGNRHMTIAPYDTFDAADGTIVLAVGNDAQWQRLCAALSRPDLAADASFATNEARVRHYDRLRASLAPLFRAARREPMIARLRGAGVPCGSVRSIDEALADPQILAREMIVGVDHPALGRLNVLGVPTRLSETPGRVMSPPPRLGEHTRAVLQGDLGLAPAEISALAARGAIRT